MDGAVLSMSEKLSVNPDRLLDSLQDLGKIGALQDGGVCRLALTDEDKAGRDWLVARMRELELDVSIDAIGNIFGVYAGTVQSPPVMIGSHIDTVRTGGLYDGAYGVLAGLEVIDSLRDAKLRLKRPIAVASFTNEEGSRFHPDMFGSLVYVGGLSLEHARQAEGIDGLKAGDELARIGYQGAAPVGEPNVAAYVELHIEQGPVLEKRDLQIGIVEEVQGISWTEFVVEGVSNHAGTTPMELRRDAGHAACMIATFVRELVLRTGGRQIGTVGSIRFEPNLVNVIPKTARLTVDLRNTDESVLASVEREVEVYAERICTENELTLSRKRLARFEPVKFDADVVEIIATSVEEYGFSSMRMPSGAGHDAQMLARVCPSAMIFVPSVGGLSHNVNELTYPEDLVNGANILLDVVMKLGNRE